MQGRCCVVFLHLFQVNWPMAGNAQPQLELLRTLDAEQRVSRDPAIRCFSVIETRSLGRLLLAALASHNVHTLTHTHTHVLTLSALLDHISRISRFRLASKSAEPKTRCTQVRIAA